MLLYGELSILQDSNMVKIEPRPQTHTAIIVGAETELVCGSENYSGTKISYVK